MGDPVIDEMVQELLVLRRTNTPLIRLRRWVEHLRDVVNPKLEELAAQRSPSKATKP